MIHQFVRGSAMTAYNARWLAKDTKQEMIKIAISALTPDPGGNLTLICMCHKQLALAQ